MKKVLLPLSLFCFLLLNESLAQTPFQKLIRSGSEESAALDVAVSADNNIGMAGFLTDTTFIDWNNAYVVKTNSTGQMAWNHVIYLGATSYAQTIARTSDNGFIVAGAFGGFGFSGDGAGGVDTTFIMKFSSSGQVQWARSFYTGDYYCKPYKVVQAADGGYLILGRFEDYGMFNTYLLKLNSNGQFVWVKNFSESNMMSDIELTAMLEEANGNITLGGFSYNPTPRFVMIQLASNGSLSWCQSQKLDDGWDYGINSIHRNAGKYYVIAKNYYPYPDDHFIMYATNATGMTQMAKVYLDTLGNTVFDVNDAVKNGNNMLLAGNYFPDGKAYPSAALMNIDTSGNINWAKYYGDDNQQKGHAVDLLASGNIVFVGDAFPDSLFRSGSQFYEIFFTETDPLGNVACNEHDFNIFSEPIVLIDTACLISIASFGSLDTLTYTLAAMYRDTTVCIGVGINDPVASSLSLYPNPSSGQLYLQFEKPLEKGATVIIFDYNGRQVATHQLAPGLSYASLSNGHGYLTPGMYIVHIRTAGQVITRKWIIGK